MTTKEEALHDASKAGDLARITSLLDEGVDVHCRRRHGVTPLHQAASFGRFDVARLLLDRGADMTARDKDAETPMHKAAYGGKLRVVGLLLDRGALADARATDGRTPLHKAAYGGEVGVVRLLLDRGADINARDKITRATPLHDAAFGGDFNVVRLLLEHGADVDARNMDGKTPWMTAQDDQEDAKCAYVAAVIADYSRKKTYAKRLWNAVRDNKSATIERLVARSFAPCHSLLLHKALTYDDPCLLQRLLPSLDVEAVDTEGYSVLARAVEECHMSLVQQLLHINVNVHATVRSHYLRKKRDREPVGMQITTMDVAWALAHALADIHEKGLVHRDVKSPNVLLSTAHGIKLGDFGTARTVDAIVTGGVGSQLWMAPEVFGDNKSSGDRAYSAAADIFSFGVVLSEVHTVDEPYAGQGSPSAIVAKVLTGELSPATKPTCDDALRMLITACVAFEPAKRPTAKKIIAFLAMYMPTHEADNDCDADGFRKYRCM
ncbi:TKL protein kinase [Saprolegnia diclina VS20]|uniref:TKL protein kinase n=1 Tax=Saprolegnia diclina (strain VS20) TaxID=1156394 RepID=T0R9M5_SAPDV|nr:TKL protein kinase [Saprolegnia diclina VS20]EQC28838.1 TKL protein kinase [Saprolegnia diclina VS20]|eukprot:XP_008617833.1 TKL protein kinase [Saprolegnia diclina VS20]